MKDLPNTLKIELENCFRDIKIKEVKAIINLIDNEQDTREEALDKLNKRLEYLSLK